MAAGSQPERNSTGREPEKQAATATYIGDLCADLARMARKEGLDALAYILDMARLEAQANDHPAQPSAQ